MDEPEIGDAAATVRSQCVVHFQDRNHEDAARLLAATLDRPGEWPLPAVLVVTPTADDALRLAEAQCRTSPAGGRSLTPITASGRGRRQVAARPAAIVGAPSELLPLLREAHLRLGDLRAVVLIWPEELLKTEQIENLESLIGEVPRSADRMAIIAHREKAVDEFLERVMWRARRMDHAAQAAAPPTALRYLVAGPGQRISALRAILDALDPESATLVTFTDDGEASARAAVRAFGLDDSALRSCRGVPDAPLPLAVLYEDVPPMDALLETSARARDIVAVVDPSRIAALRAVAGGGASPFSWTGSLATARSTLDALRDTLRDAVANGVHTPWMPVVEPLLADVDAVEVAAAAVALLDRERRKTKSRRPAAAEPARDEAPARRTGPGTQDSRGRGGFPDREAEGRRDRRGPGDRPAGGKFGRPGSKSPRGGGNRPDRDDGPRGPRQEGIERVPRAAKEGAEWAARGERLRHARRDRPGSDKG